MPGPAPEPRGAGRGSRRSEAHEPYSRKAPGTRGDERNVIEGCVRGRENPRSEGGGEAGNGARKGGGGSCTFPPPISPRGHPLRPSSPLLLPRSGDPRRVRGPVRAGGAGAPGAPTRAEAAPSRRRQREPSVDGGRKGHLTRKDPGQGRRGAGRNRTDDRGFAVLCLTTWLRRLERPQGPEGTGPRRCTDRVRAHPPDPCRVTQAKGEAPTPRAGPPQSTGRAGNRTRTGDPHLGKVVLYH